MVDGRRNQDSVRRIVRTDEERAAQAEDEPSTKGYALFLQNRRWDCCIVSFPDLCTGKGNGEYYRDDKERNDASCTESVKHIRINQYRDSVKQESCHYSRGISILTL